MGAHRGGHPRRPTLLYKELYERTKRRLGKQRGSKGARVEARKLTEATWCILTRNEPFAPAGPTHRALVG